MSFEALPQIVLLKSKLSHTYSERYFRECFIKFLKNAVVSKLIGKVRVHFEVTFNWIVSPMIRQIEEIHTLPITKLTIKEEYFCGKKLREEEISQLKNAFGKLKRIKHLRWKKPKDKYEPKLRLHNLNRLKPKYQEEFLERVEKFLLRLWMGMGKILELPTKIEIDVIKLS